MLDEWHQSLQIVLQCFVEDVCSEANRCRGELELCTERANNRKYGGGEGQACGERVHTKEPQWCIVGCRPGYTISTMGRRARDRAACTLATTVAALPTYVYVCNH